MTRYSKDVCNFMDKEALCFQASRAAKHYHFNGFDFKIRPKAVIDPTTNQAGRRKAPPPGIDTARGRLQKKLKKR